MRRLVQIPVLALALASIATEASAWWDAGHM